MTHASMVAAAPLLSMPEPLQTIYFWVSLVAMLAVVIYAMTAARRLNSPVPILLVLGAFCSIVLEPLCSYLGHVEHPAVGNIAMFTTVDRVIPWHIAFNYTAGFGAVYLIVVQRRIAGRLTRSFVLKTALIATLCFYFGETIGVATRLWVYFEPQPLWPWRMAPPPTWSFLNATSQILGACLIAFLLPHLRGARQVLIVALCPVATVMAHFGAGFPFYNLVNAAASPLAMDLAAALSILLSVLLWWVAAILATTPMEVEVGWGLALSPVGSQRPPARNRLEPAGVTPASVTEVSNAIQDATC